MVHDRADPNLPWYAWYPGDFLRMARGWPLIAKGAFRELYDAQWDAGGKLPVDPEELRGIVGASRAQWKVAWKYIEEHFPIWDGFRQHYQLEIRRGEALEAHAARRRGAQKTNAKRWGTKVMPLTGVRS